MGSAIGSIAGSIIGGNAQKDAAESSAEAMIVAAQIAAEAAKPYSVSGSPIGDLSVSGRNIDLALSSQAKGLLDLYAGEAGQGLEAATQERLSILDQLAARGEEDARRFTTERLFAAGNLGTHAGTRQIGEVERAIADARLSRMLGARQMAFNERAGAFNNALAMYQLPTTLAGLSRNSGVGAQILGTGMMNAASIQGASDLGRANAMTPIYSQVGGAIGGFLQDKIGSIFNSGSSAFGADMYGSAFGGLYSPF